MEIGDRISITVWKNDVIVPLRRREATLTDINGQNGIYKTDDTDTFSSPLALGVDEIVQRLLKEKGSRNGQSNNSGGDNGRSS